MVMSKNTNNLPFGRISTLMLLSSFLVAPGLAQASKIMPRSEMRRVAQQARGGEYDFEVTCDASGSSTFRLGYPGYAADGPLYPPEMAKCTIFGNQDQARYLCMCADLEDPVAGWIPGGELPTAFDPATGVSAFDAFESLCTSRFSSACGPFPDPVEVHCADEFGECTLDARGFRRDGGLNALSSDCYCSDGPGWFISQELNEDISLDRAGADQLCKAQLESCSGGDRDPVFHDFQLGDKNDYGSSRYGCSQELEDRYDECGIFVNRGGTDASYRCDCAGNYISGELDIDEKELATFLATSCTDLLIRCEDFAPEEDEEEDDDEDEEDTEHCPEDEDDHAPDWEDILDALGCRAAPGTGFGFQSLLGFGMVIILGGRLRRRRGA